MTMSLNMTCFFLDGVPKVKLMKYLIKIELQHDSLEGIGDTCYIFAQNEVQNDEKHKYHRVYKLHSDGSFVWWK